MYILCNSINSGKLLARPRSSAAISRTTVGSSMLQSVDLVDGVNNLSGGKPMILTDVPRKKKHNDDHLVIPSLPGSTLFARCSLD
jgi:hypothetical protein